LTAITKQIKNSINTDCKKCITGHHLGAQKSSPTNYKSLTPLITNHILSTKFCHPKHTN